MFKAVSNAAFNNTLFSRVKIDPMHETMSRLYEVASDRLKITGQSAVARLLNASPQAVKNWEARGVSSDAMIEAEKVLGCSPYWLKTGEGGRESKNGVPTIPRAIDPSIAEVIKLMEATDAMGRAIALNHVQVAMREYKPQRKQES